MITKKTLLYNFIFGASTDTKIKTYYHLLEPLFHTMSDHNMFLNLGYHDKNESFPNSIVTTQKSMVENVTKDFNKLGLCYWNVVPPGIEPGTQGFSVLWSTNWAKVP